MPDLMTHFLSGFLVRHGKKNLPIFYLGLILPDILTRPLYKIFPQLYYFFMPLHTPFVLIIVCYFISSLFEVKIKKEIFMNLLFGVFLHLFLDLFQKHIGEGYTWLFPFSYKTINCGLFWPEDTIYILPFLIFFIIFVEIFVKKKKHFKQ